MESVPNTEINKDIKLFRPREVISDFSNLFPEVGLFGTCGSPASTWRKDIFIPKLEKYGLDYFNPQIEPGEWTLEMVTREAEHLAKDEVIVLPISKETHGYGSLGEAGWAILGALLRGQKLGIFIEEDENAPGDARRSRRLFKELATKLQHDYPVFQFENSMEDLATWAVVTLRERLTLKNSKIRTTQIIQFPKKQPTENTVGVFGTSTENSEWRKKLIKKLKQNNINTFGSFKKDWNNDDIAKEIKHKTTDRVILQIITGETTSFGSIAESGLLALSAFVRGQAYGLYLEDYPGNPKSDTNRARALIRAHAKKLNEQFPGIVFMANSIEELQNWAIKYMKSN